MAMAQSQKWALKESTRQVQFSINLGKILNISKPVLSVILWELQNLSCLPFRRLRESERACLWKNRIYHKSLPVLYCHMANSHCHQRRWQPPWTEHWEKVRRPGVQSWLSCQTSSCHNSQEALDLQFCGSERQISKSASFENNIRLLAEFSAGET